MKAFLNLRYNASERGSQFQRGLVRLGYTPVLGLPTGPVEPDDLLVSWNLIGTAAHYARQFAKVLVTENATWGNDFNGSNWLTLCRDHHNLASSVTDHGPERWDRLGVELSDWRTEGETVILCQRGIGSPPVAQPGGWAERAWRKYGGRIRTHPGRHPGKPLMDDLAKCGRVITWGSGAAVKALMAGIPVTSELPGWIGECDGTDSGRLATMRRLAWGQWTTDEIASGEAFRCVLNA